MNDRERAELEYYRQMYGQTAPDQTSPPMQHLANPYGAPAAQDALTEDEMAAFWPEELDYHPKYQIAERHRQIYSAHDLRKSD